LTPAGRQWKRDDLGNEAEILKGRRRRDANAHRVIERRRPVLSAYLGQTTVSGQRDQRLPVVKVLAVVQLDGVAVDRVVEQVDLQEPDCDPLPRFLAADQL